MPKRGRYKFKYRIILHHRWNLTPTVHYPLDKTLDNEGDQSKRLESLVINVESITGGHIEQSVQMYSSRYYTDFQCKNCWVVCED